MTALHLSRTARPSAPEAPRRTPLRVVGAALPDAAQRHAPAASPARVRALPVAVPARRRPLHPTRGAGRPVESLPGGAARSVTELWADVRPWGDEVRAPRPAAVPAAVPAERGTPVRRAATSPAPQVTAPARLVTPPLADAPAPRTAAPARRVAAPAARPAASPLPALALRAVAVLVLAALLGAAAWLGVALAGGGAAQAAAPEAPAQLVAVAPGQTLWEIASAHAPAGTDVRDTVEAIAVANGLSAGQVRAGQVLEIPADR